MNGKGKDFINGCSYCGSIYNVDYLDKNIGAKLKYNYVMKDNKYKFKIFLKDFICCLAISTFYCISTGRTFTIFDILKILGLALIGSLLFFYVFYFIDLQIIINKVIKEKNKQHQKQEKFWEDMSKYNISKDKLFNNLNNELQEFFYDDSIEKNKNIIDFDIIDYESYDYFVDNNEKINIKVNMNVRIIEINNDCINSEFKKIEVVLVQNEISECQPGIYMVKCRGCGASIDILKDKCEYCGKKVNYLQRWYIDKISIC